MSSLDSYRRRAQALTAEIVRLTSDIAGKKRKVADARMKVHRAKDAASRSSSSSTVQSKLREIQRLEGEASQLEKSIATLEVKVAHKNRELAETERKVVAEQERQARRATQDAERAAQEHKRSMSSVSNTLERHDQLHSRTLAALHELQEVPKKIVVLFLASNPLDQPPLRLDEEARAVSEMIRKSKHRDAVRLESSWAARPLDVLQALNEHEPTVLHFSGHGSTADDLVFQDDIGRTKLVSREALVQTLVASSSSIRLVFLNACHSSAQASALVEYIDAAIGMTSAIGDAAARVFAAQFYSSIGFGHSMSRAFEQARAALLLEGIAEDLVPKLFIRDGLDAAKIVLVDAAE